MNEKERLATDADYFEEKQLELAERFMHESDSPLSFFDAMDLAQDRLMVAAGF